MGTFSYKSAIVCGDDAAVQRCYSAVHLVELSAHAIRESPPLVTPVFVGNNGTSSFAILPEGSKLGWPRNTLTQDCIETALYHARELRADLTVQVSWFGELGNGTEVSGRFAEVSGE